MRLFCVVFASSLAMLSVLGCGTSTSSGSSTTAGTGGSGGSGGSGGAGASGSKECPGALQGVGASCAGYDLGQECGFGDEPAYSCTCTKDTAGQTWDCVQVGPGSGPCGDGVCDSAAGETHDTCALDCP